MVATLIKDKKDNFVGIINYVRSRTLITAKKPWCVAVPNIYHGLKREYFQTRKEAEEWIWRENA